MYDYLIVGAGMFGATFARLATDDGKKCLVIDKRDHIAGNCYTEKQEGIDVHKYGPHIFHCNDEKIWEFVNRFAGFNNFRNQPISISGGKVYSLPFNMYTFNHMWGVTTPQEAMQVIESQKLRLNDREPENLEEQALSQVGTDIYEKLIRGYTAKQWQRDPKNLPASIIKRLPVRLTWDNNYFNDKYQGVPQDGYTALFENMLEGIDVQLGIDYLADKGAWSGKAKTIVFTGKIDDYFGGIYGELEYRTLEFDTWVEDTENYQGNAVINYGDQDVPWTRIIEHKHFTPGNRSPKTVVTKEIPSAWSSTKIPYYPVGDEENSSRYSKYRDLAEREVNVIFGGRLSEYKYYDMHQVIGSAFAKYRALS
ncbi:MULTISPECIES: UDP-galactopyranose mutase [unclassified Burkholderia]|uniref:UDP-galactopyranose mutase n=1 Tax=unclassified Burkholderia TaxID=2613784 RepID=UPI00075EE309|nr:MULTISPECIES: UDP-galactopyranose mutase [unclassified Burkholderia]KUY91574.1 UDP-galactopyranose mutase [Burkholderia sp. RF7-non_BP4]KUY97388.1 UDP-galactopyranose mutase [Burkholderia sp. RF7-non_BP1]